MGKSLSPIGRVAYPTLVTARSRSEGKPPRFSVTLVFSEDVDLTPLHNAINAVAKIKFKGKIPKGLRSPLRPGTDRMDQNDGTYPEGFCETDTFVEFWKYEQYGVVPCIDGVKNDLLPSDVYAGMLGRVAFNPFFYDVDGNRGCGLGLEAFQKCGDGEPIGAAPVDPQECFDEVAISDEDSPF